MSITHLHVHSAFSFLEGLSTPSQLVQAAAAAGLPALALTDHYRLCGAIEFYDACHAAAIQPILGLTVEVAAPQELSAYMTGPAGQIVLLAQDLEGWANLCRISSAIHTDAGEPQAAPFDLLAAHTSGLICLSGGKRGLAARFLNQGRDEAAFTWLTRLQTLFPDRLYAELQLHHLPVDRAWVDRLVQASRRLSIPCLATHSVYYLDPAQAALQRTVTAIRLNRPLIELAEEDPAPPDSYFLPAQQLQERFSAYPDALANIHQLVERCRLVLPVGQAHFPHVELPPGTTAIQALRHKAETGARRLYSPPGQNQPYQGLPGLPPAAPADPVERALPEEVRQRLEHELQVIETCGYEALFLVMEEIIAFARSSGIPTASRGSASSSLVAHCLGITTPDPIRLNLYFERFLNPARAKPPDIDTDLCSRRRDEVIHFVYQRFGRARVAMVCTINRFRRRSALRDVAKAYGLPPALVSALAEGLPQRWYGPPDRLKRQDDPYAGLRQRFNTPLHQQILADAAALLGLPRHLSIHPGGIVISPGQITDLVPTQMATKGITATQLDLDSIERLGLVKLDLLGIRGLTVLGDVAAGIPAAPPSEPAAVPAAHQSGAVAALLTLEAIPEVDEGVADMVEHGRTIGCFQIESPGMRATLREVRARTIDDIMAALALYRPGPLTGGLKDAFVARYRGLEPAAYLHPALQTLLADTYGVILYQEQVLRLAYALAGFSLADADLLRRAMSHFDPGKQMQSLKERFVTGAHTRHNMPAPTAERVWEMMAAFAGYGFPKAHAASYARVAWQSAWCKLNYPAHFLAAVLANWGGYYGQQVYLTEARRLGLALRPPHINYAEMEFSVKDLDGQPTLFMGLNQVRELTRRTQARIRRYRPFTSLIDFLARADPRKIEAENLARAGALESFGSIPVVLGQLDRGGWRGGQLSLFDLPAAGPDWSLAEKAAAQEQILGVSVVAHPLELQAGRLASAGALTTLEAAARLGQPVRVAGMRQTWRRSTGQSGEYIYFMSLEDLEGMLEVFISASVYRQSRSALSRPGPYIIEGVVELDTESGEPWIRAARIEA